MEVYRTWRLAEQSVGGGAEHVGIEFELFLLQDYRRPQARCQAGTATTGPYGPKPKGFGGIALHATMPLFE